MKKLFSYLLISSMVVLSSCTNYDDQFDDLNTQINSLEAQIEGFSSLSSGLTALQGTVASLQTAIANIPVTPATDVSGLATAANLTALDTALTALAAEVTALTTSLANAATSAEVAALQTALTKAQSDLTDLLASNNVYTPDANNGLVINSASSLTVAESLGGKLAIINGKVTITNSAAAAMDQTKLQAVVDKMVTVTGDLTYTHSGSTTVAGVVFNKLTSAGGVHLDQESAISMPELTTTGTMTLTSDVKVTSVSLPKLTAAAFSGNAINFSKATSIDLSSLANYDPATLTITGSGASAGFDLKLAALENKSKAGVTQTSWSLTIVGTVNTLDLPLMTKGTITANDAKVVKLPLFEGTFTADNTNNHVDVTLGKSKSAYNGGPKLEKVNITGIKTSTAAGATGANYTFGASDKLTTATIAGEAGAISFNASTSLETAVISANSTTIDFTGATSLTSATVSGNSTSITFSGNSDLTSVSLTGGTSAVTVNDADELLALDLSHTTKLPTGGTQASLIVTGNAQLASLKADKVTKVGTLKITGNTELTSVSFDAITAPTTAATVQIGGLVSTAAANSGDSNAPSVTTGNKNKLTAQQIQAADAVTVSSVTYSAGTVTSNSGLSDLAAYLVAAKSVAGAKLFVAFDQVDKYIDTVNASDLEVVYSSSTLANTGVTGASVVTIANVYPATTVASIGGTYAKRSVVISPKAGDEAFSLHAAGVLLVNDLDMSSNAAAAVVDILSTDALAKAAAANVTLTAAVGGNASATMEIFAADTTNGERYTASSTNSASVFTLTNSDTVTLTVGSQSVTVTGTAINGATASGTADALVNAWATKYSNAATDRWTLATGNTSSKGVITATAKNIGTAGHNQPAAVTASINSASLSNFDVKNGSTKSTLDNKTVGNDVVVTVTSKLQGATLNNIGKYADAYGSATFSSTVDVAVTSSTELSSTLLALAKTNVDISTSTLHVTESRADVVLPEDGISGGTTVAALTEVGKAITTYWTWN